MTQLLLIHPERDAKSQIRDFVEEECRDKAGNLLQTTAASHVQAAMERLAAGEYALVICALDLPEDGTTPQDAWSERGLSLARELAGVGRRVILILPAFDPALHTEVSGIEGCDFVVFGESWTGPLQAQIETLLRTREEHKPTADGSEQASKSKVPVFGYIKIILEKRKNERRLLHKVWTDNPYDTVETEDDPDPRPQDLEELLEEAGKIVKFLETWRLEPEYIDDWWASYEWMGKKVWKLIQLANVDHALELLSEKVGGRERVRLIFETDWATYQIPLEAICPTGLKTGGSDGRSYQPLSPPVIRSVSTRHLDYQFRSRLPLLFPMVQRGRPINCLLIDATVDGAARVKNDQRVDLPEMPKGPDEIDELEKLLQKSKQALKVNNNFPIIGKINRVPNKKDSELSYEMLCEALECRGEWSGYEPWTLVHFCGHSGLGPKSKDGKAEPYVYVPTSERSGYRAEGIHVRRFASLLPEVRFLYLSSCSSADQGFAYELARQQVPAILAYKWELNDTTGQVFARSFYRHMFDPDSTDLVSAFYASQEETYWQVEDDDNTWAGATLLIQNMSKALCQACRLPEGPQT